jgi:hypothetical protein
MSKQRLHDIGKYFQTDKHDKFHEFAGKSYLNVYEMYLEPLRDKDVSFLEIGVRDGCSHRMWQYYFTKGSKIFGIDIDPRCKQVESENIQIFIGSQSDPLTIQKAVDASPEGFDVIIDDGSHVNELTIKSFDLLFKHVKPGGFYIIEDLGCSYLGKELGSSIVEGGWPGMQYNQNVSFVNNREDLDKLFNGIIKEIDLMTTKEYESISFHSRMAIIKKQG